MKKLVAIITILFMTIQTSYASSNDYKLLEKYPTNEQKVNIDDFAKQKSYIEFLEENKSLLNISTKAVTVLSKDYVSYNGIQPEIKNGLVLLNESTNKLEYIISVTEDCLLEPNIYYSYLDEDILSNEIDIKINGVNQYVELASLPLSRNFVGNNKKSYNEVGDEIRSELIQTNEVMQTKLRDAKGFVSNSLLIRLNKGENRICLSWLLGEIGFSKIELLPTSQTPTYSQYKIHFLNSQSGKTIFFQAEDYNYINKISDSAISLTSNNDPSVTPKNIKARVFNTIGGYTYRKSNQKIEYKFTVEKSGVYKIGLRVLQNYNIGLSSYRRIEIDGAVPFSELSAYPFYYNKNWKNETLKDINNNEYLFYLEKGEHILALTVVLGAQAPAKIKMQEAYSSISNIQRKIRLITGTTADINYDYELNVKIPDFNEIFDGAIGLLESSHISLKIANKENTTISNNVMLLKNILIDMKNNPDYIIQKLVDLEGSLIAFSENIGILEEQPLLLDEIKILSKEETFKEKKVGFFENISFIVTSFINSFFKKENDTGNEKKTLSIWISRGKEWGEILTEMTDSDFNKKYNTKVKLNVLPSGTLSSLGVNPLLLAINAGNSPDIVLSIPKEIPGDYAIRNAIYPLSDFKDYNQIKNRFLDSTIKPFTYKGKVYALPETMGFKVLIYRKDILSELNISIPDTWEDIYNKTIPTLYQNNMQMYIPPSLDTFLYQNNGQYYNDDGRTSALDSKESFSAFDSLVNLYKGYGVPVSLNFYNRFRTGESPIGIEGFNLYMQLAASAPEIKGDWDIAPLPGTKQKDGTITRETSGVAGEADIILKASKQKDLSWEFIKWWSSKEVQRKFAASVEGRIGTNARWNSANIDAFLSLPWRPNERKVLKEMMPFYVDPEIVIGGYYTGRHVNNAFLRVLTENQSTRDSLEQAVININAEMRRKREVMKVD